MKRSLALLLALATSAVLNAQVFLTTFGTDDFSINADYSSPDLEQTANSLHLAGDSLSAMISGDFLFGAIDVSEYSSALTLSATVFDAPDVGFSIFLVDENFSIFRYNGFWSDFTTGQNSTVTLYAASDQSDPFDFTQVIGIDFGFDSLSGENLDITFNGLSAVPEPSAFALIAGLAGLGFVATRRRR